MILPLMAAAFFWLAAYLVAGWLGVLVLFIVGTIGELALFGSYELTQRQARRTARRRWQAWTAHDAEVRFRG